MGLTSSSVGLKAAGQRSEIKKRSPKDKVIAIAGNPNVGKSTVFNNLTGLNQHTGNWPGKTVASTQGYCSGKKHSFVLVDIPGTYSLMANSAEEEIARDFLCFGKPDAIVVICDATCLQRNLNLVLQTTEISDNVIVCVNLMDEANRKNIRIDLESLSDKLGVPVIGTTARKKKSLAKLVCEMEELFEKKTSRRPLSVKYPKDIEDALSIVEPALRERIGEELSSRWLSLKLLECDSSLVAEIQACLGRDFLDDEELKAALERAKELLNWRGINADSFKDLVVTAIFTAAAEICSHTVFYDKSAYAAADRKLDRVLTSKQAGYPVMLALLLLIFWITINGANYPTRLLSAGMLRIQNGLSDLFLSCGAPAWLHSMLVLGVFRVLGWVVSVMLPPMAIFFPLFTLLEDSGYLPRVAYNLDRPFKRCRACGKQALTMCMGFGCNAAGIVSCRIIDSPRERLLAMLTNNFVPCNGRFPALIALMTMLLSDSANGALLSVLSALMLTAVIVMGIAATFAATKLLSKTLLKGIPSSYTLELPPYRIPQVGKVIVHSIFERTLYVLGRAVCTAAPAGLIIWLSANITVNGTSVLTHCAAFLDPLGKLMGMDGVILIAFVLGLPANEIVMPIIIMAYMSQGSISELGGLTEMKRLFVENGWTWVTAVSTMIFFLMHWPCATTLITIRKESGSWKWTAASFLIPTAAGVCACMVFANIAKLLM